jgi:hypothetical protein
MLTGCGTVCNFAGGVVHPDREPRVYGGVQRDLEIIEKAINAHPDNPPNMGKGAVFLVALAAVDPMLCLFADTITLPITISIQYWRESSEKSNEAYSTDAKNSEQPVVSLGQPVP